MELNKNTIMVTTCVNVGIGFWTALCKYYCDIMGIESTNYNKKMTKALALLEMRVKHLVKQYPDYEIQSYSILYPHKLSYIANVTLVKKK